MGLHDVRLGGLSKMQYPTIPLSEVEKQWLHAWRELGFISQVAYEGEIKRRRAQELKAGAVYRLRPSIRRQKMKLVRP
jgi:hypothetical protein